MAHSSDRDAEVAVPSPNNQNSGCVIWFTKLFTLGICIGIMLAGWAAMKAGWAEWQHNRESSGWPEVQGTVKRAWVDTVKVAPSNTIEKLHRSQLFVVKVDYRVVIDGKTFEKTSDAAQQTPEGEENSLAVAENVAAGFADGSAIAVYYKPGDVENTLRLKRVEVASAVWIVLGLGGGLLSMVLGFCGAWWVMFFFGKK